MNVTVRRATTADAQAACIALRRSITECCVDDHRNEPRVLAAWLQNKTPENVGRWFAAPDNFSLVATCGARLSVLGCSQPTASLRFVMCCRKPVLTVLEHVCWRLWRLMLRGRG